MHRQTKWFCSLAAMRLLSLVIQLTTPAPVPPRAAQGKYQETLPLTAPTHTQPPTPQPPIYLSIFDQYFPQAYKYKLVGGLSKPKARIPPYRLLSSSPVLASSFYDKFTPHCFARLSKCNFFTNTHFFSLKFYPRACELRQMHIHDKIAYIKNKKHSLHV